MRTIFCRAESQRPRFRSSCHLHRQVRDECRHPFQSSCPRGDRLRQPSVVQKQYAETSSSDGRQRRRQATRTSETKSAEESLICPSAAIADLFSLASDQYHVGL